MNRSVPWYRTWAPHHSLFLNFNPYGTYTKVKSSKNWQLCHPSENYFDNPFEDYEDKEFTQLPLREKVKVLHQLCEYRLEVSHWRFSSVSDPDPDEIKVSGSGFWIRIRFREGKKPPQKWKTS